MKLMVISLFILISAVSALDFQMSSPSSVNLNEQFTVSITADTSDSYDAKIFVQNSNKEILSEVYNEGWKNSFYYFKSTFPKQTKFDIRIIKSSESSLEICVRLRKSGKTSFSEQCSSISLNLEKNLESELSEDEILKGDIKEETKNEIEEKLREIPIKVDLPIEEEIEGISYQTQNKLDVLTKEKIILGASQKSNYLNNSSEYKTKEYSLRSAIIYSFIALCVAIIILLALRML